MRGFVPEILFLVLGVACMALLLILGALSRGWIALLCFLGVAVVYHTWFRHLIKFVLESSNIEMDRLEDDDDEDEDIFPSA